jgi:CrcB protein
MSSRLHALSDGGAVSMNTFATTLWLALGGAIGTVARYWIAVWALPVSRSLPWGTIGINIAGSFVIGFIGTLTLASGRHPLTETARLFIMVGLCGGFTTFSSFSLQTLDLLRGDAWMRALLNIALSVLLCLAAVAVGHALAAQLNSGARVVAQNTIEEEAS